MADPSGNGIVKRTALNVTAVATLGTDYAGVGDTAWTNINAVGGSAPAYANAWANAFTTGRFKKDGQGNVDIQGSVSSGTLPTTVAITVFTLTAGYRPSQVIYRSFTNASGVSVPWTGVTVAAIQILTTGEVQLTYCASNAFLSIAAQFSTL